MKDIDWSKAPEGATHWVGSKGFTVLNPWEKHTNGNRYVWKDHSGDWNKSSMSGLENFDLIVERPTQWKGPQDGLPPVGTECEYYKNDEWRKGVIFGHRKHRNGAVDVFIDFGSEWDYTSDLPRFRPIQSERDKAIEAMHADFDMISCNTGHVKVSDLYDAGYRKPMSREDAEKILCSIAKDLKNGDLRFSVRQIILNELGYKD